MFADFGLGIFSVIFSSLILKIQPDFWMFFVAIILAVAPDFDFLYYLPKRGDTKYDHKHRDLIHYPLIYLPSGFVIFFLFGKIWALIFLFASLFHFIHDSIGIGWGIKWLFPFSDKNFALFYLYSRENKKGLRKFIISFNKEELKKAVKLHGDPNWIKNIYFKWHPIAKVEFAIFVLAIISLAIFLF